MWSSLLFKEFAMGCKIAVVSDITLAELDRSPAAVRALIGKIPAKAREEVALNEEARRLARAYLYEKVVSRSYMLDAQHIAIATVHRVDVLASWNFKHIVNWKKIRLYNAVNMKEGYGSIDIRSPREVLDEEDL